MQRHRPLRLAALAAALCLVPPSSRAADPQPYTVAISPTGDAALDGVLNGTSQLEALRETAPAGAFALIARARADHDRLVTALHSAGYYKGEAVLTIAGRPLDDPGLADALDAAPADPPAEVKAQITLGPLFHVGEVKLDGDVPAAAAAKLDLPSGAPAAAGDVLAAGARLLTALRDQGYALAKVAEPVATLRPDDNLLDVSFAVASGPRVDLGAIGVAGEQDVNESWIRRRLLIHSGEQFSPTAISKARDDLAAAGVFSTVRITPADMLDADGRIPVQVDVAERDRHAVNFTLDYSTDFGPGASVTWQHRNLLGNAEQLNLTAAFTGGGTAERDPGYNTLAQFIKPDFFGHDQALQADVGAVREDLQAYKRKAITGDLLLNDKFSDHWSGSFGLAAEQEEIEQEGTTRDYTLIGLPVTAKYDDTNSLFEPTRGVRVNASVTPTESLGTRDATFVISQLGASTYLDLTSGDASGRSVLALRGLVGESFGASQFELPPDKRFYAGGSATVRGYRYQSVGPKFADNTPEGGTAVSAGTIEFRQRILSSFGAVAFVDGGQVSSSGAPFGGNFSEGAGIGARYYTPIGPIRLDVAVPLGSHKGSDTLELYIGIGEAF
jgi:translocation and assembly module TamA